MVLKIKIRISNKLSNPHCYYKAMSIILIKIYVLLLASLTWTVTLYLLCAWITVCNWSSRLYCWYLYLCQMKGPVHLALLGFTLGINFRYGILAEASRRLVNSSPCLGLFLLDLLIIWHPPLLSRDCLTGMLACLYQYLLSKLCNLNFQMRGVLFK